MITENSKREENREFVQHFYEIIFEPEWWDLLHEDTVFEFPYAPSLGIPERFAGRDTVTAYLKVMVEQVGALKFRDIVIVGTEDPHLFVNEYKATLTTPKGTNYDQVYITKVRVKDGKVILFREFWDPARVIQAGGEFTAN